MAGVTDGIIPRSKIKSYAEEDLGLIGDEVDLFISIMRRVEQKSFEKPSDPEQVKGVVSGLAAAKGKSVPYNKKKPRVRNQRP